MSHYDHLNRREYDQDFKRRAVEMTLGGRGPTEVARDLDIPRSCLTGQVRTTAVAIALLTLVGLGSATAEEIPASCTAVSASQPDLFVGTYGNLASIG